MAMTTPVLISVPAFDATQDFTFTFSVYGGNQVNGNTLTIVDQDVTVTERTYTHTLSPYYPLNNTIPANSLTNGHLYNATVVTYGTNSQGQTETSAASAAIQFRCYSTPTFTFTDWSSTVGNSSHTFKVNYVSSYEPLQTYRFILYDAQQIVIADTGVLYSGATGQSTTVSHTFDGLRDGSTYYIKALGQTQAGMNVETDLKDFTVQYTYPTVFSLIGLTNNCLEGYITVRSNLSPINGTATVTPTYITEGGNTLIDLRNNTVAWTEGYALDSNFTGTLWGRTFTPNTVLMRLYDSDGNTLTIRYVVYQENSVNKAYAQLIMEDATNTYYAYSSSINVVNNHNLQLWFRRVGSLYDINLVDLSV